MFIFKIQQLFLGLSLIIIFANVVLAQKAKQQPVIKKEIAVINPDIFYFDDKGIKELLEVKNKIGRELEPQQNEILLLVEKIHKLENEIKALSALCAKRLDCSLDLIGLTSKYEEHESLKCKIKSKIEEANTLFEKRNAELTSEINKEVGKALKQFAENRKFLVIFQTSKLNSFCFDCEDITEEFIKFYNEDFSKTKSQ